MTRPTAEALLADLLDDPAGDPADAVPGGIGLLVTVLVRANRAKQKLLAFGLTEHYQEIFELTRLDEAIGIYATEADALAAAA